jgi:peptidase M1-like protein
MRINVASLLLLLLMSITSFAQLHDNEFRNSDNKYYWQNRRPDKDYWQQDVQYKLYAIMREDENMIDGAEELTYWNNSPDTLHYVYFHLYQNAFVEGSYLHELEKANKTKSGLGKKEAAGLGTVTDKVQVDGQDAKTELDNTILKVYLPRPLLPGSKIVIKMSFKTYYDNGLTRRRMQMWNAWGFMHYNGVQWYPKMCVYDRMHGWDTYQHLNKEFYGDFGLFDVTLDFPSNYIVEATGVLQNRDEVLPKELRDKLEISNFKDKKWEEPPSTIIPYEKGKRKQWHFIGNNVHDFAFTGDPSYRMSTAYWNGVACVAIVQEPHAAGWQNATDYMTKIIKTFSEDIGMYCYPKIVAADARDGMEYPMITLDGGSEPGYRGLFTHEIGHNWFYGQVGSNETYRAAMDEGFTQFLTAWGLRKIDGDNQVTTAPRSGYRKRFSEPINVLDRNVLNRYTSEALNHNEIAINTHSDDFNNALNHGGGYGLVYFKTASMLYNLQYVLGDSLFQAAIHHYFEQWKFAHPYFEDFRASVIQYTHVDLSWFFDEWFETVKTLDYSIGGIHKIPGTDSFAIKFKRPGEMQMPIDFTVTAKDGSRHSFYIPNTWFEKQTAATILPKWYGWGKLNSDYIAHVQIPSGIRNVQIDTSYRLADKDMVDNYKSKCLPLSPLAIKTSLDGGLSPQSDRRQYRLDIRPDLWWNPIDGIKVGAHFEGDYLFSLYKIDASVWLNTHALQENIYKPLDGSATYAHFSPVNYSFNYNSPITRNMPKLQLQLNSRFLDGLWSHRGGFNWLLSDKNFVQLYMQSMWRPDGYAVQYLTDPGDWSSTRLTPNNSFNLAWGHNYTYERGSGRYTFSFRAPFLGGSNQQFNYSYGQLESVNYQYIDRLEVRSRLFGRYGMGTILPSESLLYMAGASPEEEMENKYTRSVGLIPTEWQGISPYNTNHFEQGGGLGLRGYAGYYAPDERNGSLQEGYKGRSGASANVELGFENYMPWHPRLLNKWVHANVYAFGDAGIMELSDFNSTNYYSISPSGLISSVHVDAGLGFAFTIKNWGVFEKAKPLTLRLDLPIFLNRPPFSNDQYATLRYVIGVNRAF